MKLRTFTIICIFSLVLLARWMLSLKVFPFHLKVFIFIYFFVCMHVYMCALKCYSAHIEFREQLLGIGFLLQLYGY